MTYREGLPLPMPAGIAALPVDERGYPVPWFVAWQDGKPDFRCMDGRKLEIAKAKRRCWVCGHELFRRSAVFVIGPMCAVNRVSAEPPNHRECAEWSAVACPFLSMPKMRRNENDLPVDAVGPSGIMLARNPGVTLLWECRAWSWESDGQGGEVCRIGDPLRCDWYALGRPATRAEVMASIESGLPTLEAMADDAAELSDLHAMRDRALGYLPGP